MKIPKEFAVGAVFYIIAYYKKGRMKVQKLIAGKNGIPCYRLTVNYKEGTPSEKLTLIGRSGYSPVFLTKEEAYSIMITEYERRLNTSIELYLYYEQQIRQIKDNLHHAKVKYDNNLI